MLFIRINRNTPELSCRNSKDIAKFELTTDPVQEKSEKVKRGVHPWKCFFKIMQSPANDHDSYGPLCTQRAARPNDRVLQGPWPKSWIPPQNKNLMNSLPHLRYTRVALIENTSSHLSGSHLCVNTFYHPSPVSNKYTRNCTALCTHALLTVFQSESLKPKLYLLSVYCQPVTAGATLKWIRVFFCSKINLWFCRTINNLSFWTIFLIAMLFFRWDLQLRFLKNEHWAFDSTVLERTVGLCEN